MKPSQIYLTEEAVLSPKYLPDYMQKSRKFRIEYRDPASGFSNFEGDVWVGNCPNIFEITDKIEELLRQSFAEEIENGS